MSTEDYWRRKTTHDWWERNARNEAETRLRTNDAEERPRRLEGYGYAERPRRSYHHGDLGRAGT